MEVGEKKCPFCAEVIRAEAIKCQRMGASSSAWVAEVSLDRAENNADYLRILCGD
jgi:hypothetical protein